MCKHLTSFLISQRKKRIKNTSGKVVRSMQLFPFPDPLHFSVLLHPEPQLEKKKFGSCYDEIMMKPMMKPMM